MSMNELITKELVGKIEKLETDLIQHIRISGIRKERECFLIDGILEQRKLRKQAYSYFTKKIESLRFENQEVVEKLDSMLHDFKISQKLVEEHIQTVQKECKNKYDVLLKLKDEETMQLRFKYEDKLMKLEGKIGELHTVKQRRDETFIEERAKILHEERLGGITGEYEKKIEK
jgi:hypothetical protein